MSLTPRDRLRRLACYYEDQVGRSRAEQMAAAAMLRVRPVAQRRWAVIAATSVASLFGGVIGLGAISDPALPGQVLYPVDRAYEWVAALVGVNTDPGEERLVEAIALLDLGRDLEAIRPIEEALLAIGRDAGVEDWTPAVPETSVETSVTVPSVAVAPPTTEPGADTPDPAIEPAVVAAEAPDASNSLRLATEYLLQTVRDARNPKDAVAADEAAVTLRAAASEVVAAAESVKAKAAMDIAQEEGSTTTTVPDGSTTTTVPDGSTTTTVPDESTTTTVPDESTTTTVPGGSTTTTVPGPIIILPPQP